MRATIALFAAGVSTLPAVAQFVWPKPEYNRPEPGVYREDPFIVEYRKKFFAVFKGDVATFDKAYAEIEAMLKKNPRDARALVWLGNGQTVRAGVLRFRGRKAESDSLAEKSRITLRRAVALRPDDPNIYMMRAATLYIQGMYWKPEELPRSVWTELRRDCEAFLRFVGPERMGKVSIHVRGEAYGELGVACRRLGDRPAARRAFRELIRLNRGTDYETRARKELAEMDAEDAKAARAAQPRSADGGTPQRSR